MSNRYTARSAAAFARRLADRAAWHSGGVAERGRISVRMSLASIGLPVTREFLELGCATGNEASGLFSEFTAVLGCLDHFESHAEIYSGMRVDFGTEGLYYEAGRGRNWWQYYFEPIELGDPRDSKRRTVPLWQHDQFAEGVEPAMSRHEAAALIGRHIRPRAVVLDAVDRFTAAHFHGTHIIGVHYRGTDKYEESAPVDRAHMIAAVRELAAGVSMPYKVFVATDDQPALEAFSAAFGDAMLSTRAERSSNGAPVHKQTGDGFRRGLEAAVDCFLLSRCSQLARTSSNLGLVSTYLNPELPVTLVRPTA